MVNHVTDKLYTSQYDFIEIHNVDKLSFTVRICDIRRLCVIEVKNKFGFSELAYVVYIDDDPMFVTKTVYKKLNDFLIDYTRSFNDLDS